MKALLLLTLAACGEPPAIVSAQMQLPSALMAAELREITLRAVDDSDLATIGITPVDLCQRFTARTAFPDLPKIYRAAFPFASGVTSGDKRVLDGLPPGKKYTMLVSASDTPETQNAEGVWGLPAGAKTGKGCTPSNQVAAGRTTTVSACLYFMDSMGRLEGPPVSPECPAQ